MQTQQKTYVVIRTCSRLIIPGFHPACPARPSQSIGDHLGVIYTGQKPSSGHDHPADSVLRRHVDGGRFVVFARVLFCTPSTVCVASFERPTTPTSVEMSVAAPEAPSEGKKHAQKQNYGGRVVFVLCVFGTSLQRSGGRHAS